jgi:hypothetical protein
MIDPSQYIYGYKFRELEDIDNGIEYLDTHNVNMIRAFFRGAGSTNQPLTLITHNSDYAVSQAYPKDMVSFPENVMWYSTNVDIEHPNIRSIPIGLENPEWHRLINKPNKIYETAKESEAKEKAVLVNALFNHNTHPSRRVTMDHFKTIPGCICQETINGNMFNTYCYIVANSAFTVCPRGNGIDTHRIWEAIYLGSIPLVEDCINISQLQLSGVNMLSVTYLSKVTLDGLTAASKVVRIEDRMAHTMDYWINKIRNRE